jgi:hypothetical protein
MPTTTLSGIPLLGALCVAAGLVSQAQLARCVQLQIHMYPGTPIGRIMVLQSYCTEPDIARMVAQQQAFRRAFCAAIEHASPLTIEEAPSAAPARDAEPLSALPELGAFTAAELDNSHIFGERE